MLLQLVFPHQLYYESQQLKGEEILLVEDPLFFTQYKFHQQKLLFHRASMKTYAQWLEQKGKTVHYLEAAHAGQLAKAVQQRTGVAKLAWTEVDDYDLNKKLLALAQELGLPTEVLTSPNFLNPTDDTKDFFRNQRHYYLHKFYIEQRKKHHILLEKDAKPLGGQWSFDPENRKKIPKGLALPAHPALPKNPLLEEAQAYVQAHFPDNYGTVALDNWHWPTDRQRALESLDKFCEERFSHYGTYQDAIRAEDNFLFHSLISAALNAGILSAREVVDKLLDHGLKNQVELNHLEGIIRQIIGWREFVRGLYHLEGVKQRNSNFFGFERKMPESFWTGETGLPPIDQSIKKLGRTAYNHHIERLMILGNFMLLCEIKPNEVYEWFMTFYIDAYDWVMVPNVYGMSQFADGGLITTKPYLSSSNYVLKMSNYGKGPWCAIWDGLYWRFLHVHGHKFTHNPRMKMQFALLNKMDKARLNGHLEQADKFLANLR